MSKTAHDFLHFSNLNLFHFKNKFQYSLEKLRTVNYKYLHLCALPSARHKHYTGSNKCTCQQYEHPFRGKYTHKHDTYTQKNKDES